MRANQVPVYVRGSNAYSYQSDYSKTKMSDLARGVQYVDRRPAQLNAIVSANPRLHQHMLDLAWMHKHARLSYGLVRDFLAACEDAGNVALDIDRGGIVAKTTNAIQAIAERI